MRQAKESEKSKKNQTLVLYVERTLFIHAIELDVWGQTNRVNIEFCVHNDLCIDITLFFKSSQSQINYSRSYKCQIELDWMPFMKNHTYSIWDKLQFLLNRSNNFEIHYRSKNSLVKENLKVGWDFFMKLKSYIIVAQKFIQ